ncbi:MAG: ABC transporter permease [Bacteroidota bacterium]
MFFAWFYGFHVRSYASSEVAASGGAGWELLKSLAIFTGILMAANGLVWLLKKIPAGVFRKKMKLPLDLLVMRLVEMLNSIPGFLLLLSLVAVLQKSSIFWVMAIIGLIRWTSIARYLRAELLKVKNLGYVEAAKALGFSNRRILFRHALPNALPPALVTIAFGVASAILLESTLTFLGIGLSGDEVTWGSLLAKARIFPGAWWLAVFPGAAIFVTVTIFNLLGEGLTEALAPR